MSCEFHPSIISKARVKSAMPQNALQLEKSEQRQHLAVSGTTFELYLDTNNKKKNWPKKPIRLVRGMISIVREVKASKNSAVGM